MVEQNFRWEGNKLIITSPEGIVTVKDTSVGGTTTSYTPAQWVVREQITQAGGTLTPQAENQIAEGLQQQTKTALAGKEPEPFTVETPEATFTVPKIITPESMRGATGSVLPPLVSAKEMAYKSREEDLKKMEQMGGAYGFWAKIRRSEEEAQKTEQYVTIPEKNKIIAKPEELPEPQIFQTEEGKWFTVTPVAKYTGGGYVWNTPYGEVASSEGNVLKEMQRTVDVRNITGWSKYKMELKALGNNVMISTLAGHMEKNEIPEDVMNIVFTKEEIGQAKKVVQISKSVEEGWEKTTPAQRAVLGVGTMTTPEFIPLTVSVLSKLTGINVGVETPEEIVKRELKRQKGIVSGEGPVSTHLRRQYETWFEGVGQPITYYFLGQAIGAVGYEGLPKVIGTVSKSAEKGSKIAIALAKAGRLVSTHSEVVTGIGYGVFGGAEVIKASAMLKAEKPPALIASEIAKDVANLYMFGKGLTKGLYEGFPWKFWGKEKIPGEYLVEPVVLRGEQEFPTAPGGSKPSYFIREFKTGQYKLYEGRLGGWHATGEKIRTAEQISEALKKTGIDLPSEDIVVGIGNTPSAVGLHISPSLSPHFLRIPSDTKFSGYAREYFGSQPGAYWVEFEDIVRIPEPVRKEAFAIFSKGGYTQASETEASLYMNRWLVENANKMKAYITPAVELGKTEKEAVLVPGALLKPTVKGFEKYTEIWGIRVPVYEFQVAGIGSEVKGITQGTFNKITVEGMRALSSISKPVLPTEAIIFASLASSVKHISSFYTASSAITLSTSYGPLISKVISSSTPSISNIYKISRPSVAYASKVSSFPSLSSILKASKVSTVSTPSTSTTPSVSKVSAIKTPSAVPTPSRPARIGVPKVVVTKVPPAKITWAGYSSGLADINTRLKVVRHQLIESRELLGGLTLRKILGKPSINVGNVGRIAPKMLRNIYQEGKRIEEQLAMNERIRFTKLVGESKVKVTKIRPKPIASATLLGYMRSNRQLLKAVENLSKPIKANALNKITFAKPSNVKPTRQLKVVIPKDVPVKAMLRDVAKTIKINEKLIRKLRI